MLPFTLLFVALCATLAHAQTRQQIEQCGASINAVSFEENPTWSTTDDEHFFNVTYLYDPASCTTPSQIPVTRIFLTDQSSLRLYLCPAPQFDDTGVLYSQCTRSLGQIARDVRDATSNDPDRQGDCT